MGGTIDMTNCPCCYGSCGCCEDPIPRSFTVTIDGVDSLDPDTHCSGTCPNINDTYTLNLTTIYENYCLWDNGNCQVVQNSDPDKCGLNCIQVYLNCTPGSVWEGFSILIQGDPYAPTPNLYWQARNIASEYGPDCSELLPDFVWDSDTPGTGWQVYPTISYIAACDWSAATVTITVGGVPFLVWAGPNVGKKNIKHQKQSMKLSIIKKMIKSPEIKAKLSPETVKLLASCSCNLGKHPEILEEIKPFYEQWVNDHPEPVKPTIRGGGFGGSSRSIR